jgi:hypothetical protein
MNNIRFFILTLSALICAYVWKPWNNAMAEETVEPAPVTSTSETKPEVKKSNPPSTLFSGIKGTHFSGYGGIYSRYSKIGDTYGTLMGGRGAVLLNDKFAFGAGAMGLVYPKSRERLSGNKYTGENDITDFSYGGFITEYYFNPKSLIVFSFGNLIGGGTLSFTNDDKDKKNHQHERDEFFIIEPEVNVFVNLTRFCRAGIGVSYRFISGLNTKDFGKKDFNGPTASAMVQFGWF